MESESDPRVYSGSCSFSREYPTTNVALDFIPALKVDIFQSMLLRKAGSILPNQPFPVLRSMISCVRRQTAESEVSHIIYVEISSEKADWKSTLMRVISRLQKKFVEERVLKYVLVICDAKTYNLLQSIKFEYRSCLRWMLPFPGDWHILYNYQKVLMKPYAGLKPLHHLFKLQTLDEHMSSCYNHARTPIDTFCPSTLQLSCSSDLEQFERHTKVLLTLNSCLSYTAGLLRLNTQQYSSGTSTCCSVDCFAYIALFTSLRYRNWDLEFKAFNSCFYWV